MNEKKFNDNLLNTPELPDDVYPQIQNKINKDKYLLRFIWAAAASLIVAISGYVYIDQITEPSIQYSEFNQEIEDDLQSISEFLSGESIESEWEMYAIVDNNY